MANKPGLQALFDTWRYGTLPATSGKDPGERVVSLQQQVEHLDERARSLEGLLERVTKALNFGPIAGAYPTETYDSVWLLPGCGVGDGNAIDFIGGLAGGFNVGSVKLPNAIGSVYRWTVGVRENWRNQLASLTFSYSANAGSTANIDLTWQIHAFIAPATFPAVASVAASYAGPVNAGEVVTATVLLNTGGTATVTKLSDAFLRIQVVRSGTDANANDCYFLFGELRFYRA